LVRPEVAYSYPLLSGR